MALPRAVTLRPALSSDAADIARIIRAAKQSHAWLPVMHTPDEELVFVRAHLLARQKVTIASSGTTPAGFIAIEGEWVEQLYVDPLWTGAGIGSRLLARCTQGIPVVKLHCFQANDGARRFYESHGFTAEAFRDETHIEEGLPDIVYVRRSSSWTASVM